MKKLGSSQSDEILLTKEQFHMLREAIDSIREHVDEEITDAEAIEFMSFDVIWSFQP